jgi:hypothetical protein
MSRGPRPPRRPHQLADGPGQQPRVRRIGGPASRYARVRGSPGSLLANSLAQPVRDHRSSASPSPPRRAGSALAGNSPRKSGGGLPASLAASRARDLSRLAHSEDLQRFSACSGIACWRSRLLLCGPSHSIHGSGSAIIGTCKIGPITCNFIEPPIGIEPMTYALREARSLSAHAPAALIAPIIDGR